MVHVPSSSLQNTACTICGVKSTGEIRALINADNVERWLARIDEWDLQGKVRTVIEPWLETLFCDMLKWADSPDVRCQFTQATASYMLMCLLEDNNIPIPHHWAATGSPSSGWWQEFYMRHKELSHGPANRLEEVRVTAHTPPAIRGWFTVIQESNDEERAKGWYGARVDGFSKLLKEQMGGPGGVCEGWTDEQIELRAKALCNDPRINCNFDQKGHALGGDEIEVISMKYSPRQCRDVTDGTWLSVCPLVNAHGEVLFKALVVKGCPEISDETAGILWGDDTILANSATGYSSSAINLAQWKIGIGKLKRERPELFPMVCWMDNWEGHCANEFRTWCRETGIILMFFRSHSTVWACALDNQPFGHYEKLYNKAVHEAKRTQASLIKKGDKLPFDVAAGCVRKAFDAAFSPEIIKNGHLKTIWRLKQVAGVQEMSRLTADGPAVPAIELDMEQVLERHCDKLREGAIGIEDIGPDATKTEKQAAWWVTVLNDQNQAKGRFISAIEEMVPHVRGADVERDDEGNYICKRCRVAEERHKKKAATRKWNGGCGSLGADEELALEKASERAADEVERDAKRAQKVANRAEREQMERQKQSRLDKVLKNVRKLNSSQPVGPINSVGKQNKIRKLQEMDWDGFTRTSNPAIAIAKDCLADLLEEQKKFNATESGKTFNKEEKFQEACEDHWNEIMAMMEGAGVKLTEKIKKQTRELAERGIEYKPYGKKPYVKSTSM